MPEDVWGPPKAAPPKVQQQVITSVNKVNPAENEMETLSNQIITTVMNFCTSSQEACLRWLPFVDWGSLTLSPGAGLPPLVPGRPSGLVAVAPESPSGLPSQLYADIMQCQANLNRSQHIDALWPLERSSVCSAHPICLNVHETADDKSSIPHELWGELAGPPCVLFLCLNTPRVSWAAAVYKTYMTCSLFPHQLIPFQLRYSWPDNWFTEGKKFCDTGAEKESCWEVKWASGARMRRESRPITRKQRARRWARRTSGGDGVSVSCHTWTSRCAAVDLNRWRPNSAALMRTSSASLDCFIHMSSNIY